MPSINSILFRSFDNGVGNGRNLDRLGHSCAFLVTVLCAHGSLLRSGRFALTRFTHARGEVTVLRTHGSLTRSVRFALTWVTHVWGGVTALRAEGS
eukprot:3680538-Prymnesium_polylepis.1